MGGFRDASHRDIMGWSALHHACDASSWSWRALEASLGLIEQTPPWVLNAKTWGRRPEGYTCLHLAAEGSDKLAERYFVVQKLLDWRAEVDARNAKGNTALMLASGIGVIDIMLALLSHGADANVLNDRDLSAIQSAKFSSSSAFRLLQDCGQKPPKILVPSAKQRNGVGPSRRLRRMHYAAF